MARPRKKKRTQPKNAPSVGKSNSEPKTLVVRLGAGETGRSIAQLVKDVRQMMEPGTASRLKERRANRLRDYVAMAGPLGVSHLLLFTRSEAGNTNLRLALTPRGPTLTFKVERYALAKDVQKAQRSVIASPKYLLTPPLLVMNNFSAVSQTQPNPDDPEAQSSTKESQRLISLTTSIFQSLFPPISPQATSLSSIRRVLLLDRQPTQSSDGAQDPPFILNVRHYAISTKATEVSRAIRRLDRSQKRPLKSTGKVLPDLSRLDDASDYVLDPSGAGFLSGSETEIETDAEVEVVENTRKKVLNKKQLKEQKESGGINKKYHGPDVEKRAIKLTELGPRMRLRLTKVEEGLCDGRVMYHRYINKSHAEQHALDTMWRDRRAQKEERRRVQRENIQRKKEATTKARSDPVDENGQGTAPQEHLDSDSDDAWHSDDSEVYGDTPLEGRDGNLAPIG